MVESDQLGNQYVGLTTTGVTAGVYGNLTVNRFGQITSIVEPEPAGVKAGDGLRSFRQGDDVVIAHNLVDVDNGVRFGGFNVSISDTGHITDTNRVVTVAEGLYNLGAYNVGIDEFGGINSITQRSDVPAGAGSFTTVDGKQVAYDVGGRITSVIDLQGQTPGPTPLPLRDMYKFIVTPTPTSATIEKEIYGNDIVVSNVTATTFTLNLPEYVISNTQINIHGALGFVPDVAARQLTITYATAGVRPTTPVTVSVSLRG